MKPLICIYGDGTYDNYRAALEAAGAVCAGKEAPRAYCRGLLLPGGGDIDGGLDAEEARVIGAFIAAGRPVLGICRGMQALNVWFGGTLRDHVSGHQVPGGDIVHPTVADGALAALLGTEPVVNSNHHQAIDRLGRGLVICQRTPDGIAEGFVHRTLPVLGVQWHPERQSYRLRRPDAVDAAPVFRWLVSRAAAREG